MTTKNELTVTSTSSVPDAINAINAKIAAIKLIQDSAYKTNKVIKLAGGTSVNIETEEKIDNLVKAYASIAAREQQYNQAQIDLGIEVAPVCKIDGYTKEEWRDDVKLRIAIIQQKDTLDELTGLKKEWEELMDKEDRKTLLLAKMQKFAGTSAE